MTAVARLFGLADDPSATIALFLLVAARTGGVLVAAPFLGGRLLPPPARILIGVLLAAIVLPAMVGGAAPPPPGAARLAALVAKEAFVGFAMGFVASLVFEALDMAGRLVDVLRGANVAEVLDPSSGERTSPLGELQRLAGIVIFLAAGGHRLFLRALGESFVALPPLAFPSSPAGARSLALGAAQLTGDALALGLAFAAPAAAALFLAEIALGLVARASPRVEVFFVGMPLRLALGLAAILLALGAIAGALPGAFDAALRAADNVVRSLR